MASTTASRIPAAAPFWISLALVPVVWLAAVAGGLALVLPPAIAWWLVAALDALIGRDTGNADTTAGNRELFWHRAITLVWPPVQIATLIGLLIFTAATGHLSRLEEVLLFVGMGILSGTIGIVYAHELMHQQDRTERFLADLLLASVLYSHFRSEHLLGHHRYVGTPRDVVTARYGEGFHRFFFRVLVDGLRSAWDLETERLARKGLPWWDRANPFWRYGAMQLVFVLTAMLIGGWWGLALFVAQAVTAFWQLELVNYVEHYGLVRKHLGDGKYEPVRPRHSWNAAEKASNRLLINLQRHSDHHARPDRRYPLLQHYGGDVAPQLPYGYPVMTLVALVPPLWRRVMNPRVRRWRDMFYPEITDWRDYSSMTTPAPR